MYPKTALHIKAATNNLERSTFVNRTTVKPFTVMDEFELIKAATDYSLEQDENGRISGNFYHCRLTSAFQAVLDTHGNNIIGHAAYIRSESHGELSLWPWQIFALASKDEQLIDLDRLCRAVHALNYFKKTPDTRTGQLFLSVHPRLLNSIQNEHGRTFKDFLDLTGISTSRVVIEIPPILNHDWELLQKLIINYRSYGYQVAINFSSTHGHGLPGTDDLHPDIMIVQAHELLHYQMNDHSTDNHAQDAKPLLHVRKIETQAQLTAAKQADAHYLQGNFLGKAV